MLAVVLLGLVGLALFGVLAWWGAPALPDTRTGRIATRLVIGLVALAGGALAVALFAAAHRAHLQDVNAGVVWSATLTRILFVVPGLLGLGVIVHLLAVRHAGGPGR